METILFRKAPLCGKLPGKCIEGFQNYYYPCAIPHYKVHTVKQKECQHSFPPSSIYLPPFLLFTLSLSLSLPNFPFDTSYTQTHQTTEVPGDRSLEQDSRPGLPTAESRSPPPPTAETPAPAVLQQHTREPRIQSGHTHTTHAPR